MAQMPDPFPSLLARIKRMEDRLNQRLASSPFFGTGMHPTGDGGMQVDGAMTVGGTLNVTGNTVIGGTLSLPAGIIDNAALANPVLVQGDFSGTSGFGLSVSGGYVITINRATPAGFTKVVVTAFGRIVGQNSTAADDALYSTLDINGAGGNQFPTTVLAGQGNTSSVGLTTTLVGLTAGANVATSLFASTGFANWSSSAANAADLSVTYSWSR